MAGNPFNFLRGLKKQNSSSPLSVRLDETTPFQIVEAYKTIRTNLWFALATQKSKAVVFSSALPSEGKSTTCSNLAIAMAQTDARVLLIDGDLRKPTQYKIFQRPNNAGLSRLLVGLDTAADAIQKNIVPNLDLIPSGPIPPNPSELLGSENMSVLLDKLSAHYDYIFIDSPPINIVTDSIILANRVAGMVLVARQGQSTYDELTKAVSSIEFAGANILGMIVTDVKDQNGSYGYYKYKYEYRHGASK